MSDTPRTDALVNDGKAHYMSLELARQLERELNAAKADAESWQEQAERFGQQLLDANDRIKQLELELEKARRMHHKTAGEI